MSVSELRDVGIAVAIPLTWDGFRSRAGESDWLAKYFDRDLDAEEREKYLRCRWELEYRELVADPVCKVLDLASAAGAMVCRDATLQDVRSITEAKQIAILFAHWKGPEVTFEDFSEHDSTLPFMARLASNQDDLSAWLRSQLSLAGPDISQLVKIFAAALDYAPASSRSAEGTLILEDAVTRHARIREQLNELFADLLRPGNRLELYDKMQTKEALEEAIAPTFKGVLDLPVCTSTIPADYIASRRQHSIRTIQFANEIEFVWAARCIADTLGLLTTGNFGYLEARGIVVQILRNEMKRLLANHNGKSKGRPQQLSR